MDNLEFCITQNTPLSISIKILEMKNIKHLFWLVLLTICTTANSQSTNQKPNIILIFADDLGYMDCGFTGSKQFETPNIDAMAKQGMVFRNAYAGAGNCAPSRACLLSGQYTPRHGIYAVGSTTRGPVNKMRLVPVKNTNDLNGNIVTVAEALKQTGYQTALFGKWHLGKDAAHLPKAQGFDTYFDSREQNANKKRDEPNDPKGIYSLTKKATEFIETNKNRPFFLYLAHHAIHSAIEARPLSIERFKKKGLDNKIAPYAASIYDLDDGVGLILAQLKKQGLEENTLVIFTSDNGATQQSSQEPLRGNKGGYYEGGIREPFVAYWKGTITPSVNLTPIINLDLYPTFLDVANAQIPKHLDGETLLPILENKAKTTKRESIFWHFPGYLNQPVIRGRDKEFRTRPVTVMRKGDWKIHLYHEEWLLDGGKKKIANNNSIELYNLKDDEGEHKNIANEQPKKRDELLKDVLAWLKKTNAPMPHPIDATHKPVEGDDTSEN
jgi:arylsulfatase A-like enzyme